MENRNKHTKHTFAERGAFAADKIVDRAVFNALYAVYADDAFCQKAITDALRGLKDGQAFVTSAFYGVLDNNIKLEKIISGLCETPPGKAASTVLKIGLYYLRFADMPDYAAVSRAVELSKQLNGVYSGFINAVLKKSIGFVPSFKNGLERFSYEHNAPEWLCKTLIADYGETRAASILDAPVNSKTHIRPLKRRISFEQFKRIGEGCEFTDYGCYCDRAQLDRFDKSTYTAQSLSSVKAVNAYVSGNAGGKVLDLCAAPGGKSIYISELGDYDVTACDIYPHKLELMRGLAKKAGAKINIVLNDAAKRNPDFVDNFDIVIADCPCSGTGTIRTKPDILLRRNKSDLKDLTELQLRILYTAADYPAPGGLLCYSTCSILKAENEDIVKRFLSSHGDYTLVDSVKLMPDTDGCDGFYIARLRRNTQ